MLGLASYPEDDKEAQVTQKKTGGSLGQGFVPNYNPGTRRII